MPDDIPTNPHRSYRNTGWQGWPDWLGSGTRGPKDYLFLPFSEARAFARPLQLKSHLEWIRYCKGEMPELPPKPDDIPADPYRVYKNKGWISWPDWLGKE